MGAGDDAVSVAKFHFEGKPIGGLSGEKDIDVEPGIRGEHILGTGEDVVDVRWRDDAQRDLAIDASEGHVVDLVAERRDVGAFGRVYLDHEDVLSVRMKVIGEFEGERSEAALVLSQGNAIDPNGGRGHGAFEVYEDALAPRRRGIAEAAAIGGNELVVFVVEVMPGKTDVGMGNDNGLKRSIIERRQVRAFNLGGMVAPLAIDRQNGAGLSSLLRGEYRGTWESGGGDDRAGCLDEIAS